MAKLKIAKDLFDLLYPVGTYYETSNANWTPSSAGWYGTWVEDTGGKTLVAKDSGTFKTLDANVGSETHNHTLTIGQATWYGVPMEESEYGLYIKNQSGARSTASGGIKLNTNNRPRNTALTNTMTTFNHDGFAVETTGNTYNSSTVQPSKVCRRWHRTA